jgi:hypothetical protein
MLEKGKRDLSLHIMFRQVFYLITFCLVLGLAGLGGAFYWFVVLHPGDEIRPDTIERILGRESPVFLVMARQGWVFFSIRPIANM